MVEADFSGNFTNVDNCKQNDLGVVIDGGSYEDKKNFKGQDYKQLSIGVEVNNKALTHSPSMMEGKLLVRAWGSETNNWIGKKFKCNVVRYMSQGQTKQKIEIEPLVETKV